MNKNGRAYFRPTAPHRSAEIPPLLTLLSFESGRCLCSKSCSVRTHHPVTLRGLFWKLIYGGALIIIMLVYITIRIPKIYPPPSWVGDGDKYLTKKRHNL